MTNPMVNPLASQPQPDPAVAAVPPTATETPVMPNPFNAGQVQPPMAGTVVAPPPTANPGVVPQMPTASTPPPMAQTAAVAPAPVAPPIPQTPAPALEPGQSIICQLAPGMFDAFIKILSLLDDKNIINISDSQICQGINNGTAILMTDVSKLVSGNKINLHILQPKKYLKLFKAIKGNNDVFIIDDPSRAQFILRSGSTKLWLPKHIEDYQGAALPDLSGLAPVGVPIKISKEERSKITTLLSEQANIVLLINQNQLKGYMVPETLEDSFAQFATEEVTEANADIKLLSYAFLSIPSDGDSEVVLGHLNGQYWLNTTINTAIVEIYILEALSPMQSDKLLI